MKISYKKWSIGVLFFLIFCALAMIYFTKDIKQQANTVLLSGPRFYPILLACLLIVFCLISIVFSARKPDKFIEFPNIHRPLVTLGIFFAWTLIWQFWGFFYLVSSIAIFVITVFLNPEPMSVKKIRNAIVLDAIIMGLVYLLFTLLLNVKF
ncbi:MAG: tripartite tricarboxylate transporter TctB family protein [Synergistaceae bacterium]|nr:tripartite tricarboxylate transporter TctB family protein [Synergistaceae bacterium]